MSSPRVIIIGAGWQGIAAAKSYLQINPSINLTVLDAESSFGGIWSKSRIYPGLIVDSPRGMMDYPDASMIDSSHPAFGDIPGAEVTDYLTKVAKEADLERRTRFNTIVHSIRRNDVGGWFIETDKEILECDKLIMATGIYYVPSIPNIPKDQFKGPMFHNKSLAQNHTLLTAPETTNVIVIGGAKSSFETVDLCLKAGKKVHWIIRKSGGSGPAMIVRKQSGWANNMLFNVVRTRLWNAFSPSIYSCSGFWYKVLHSGAFTPGLNFVKKLLSNSPHAFDYTVSAHAKKLAPEINNVFWSTTSYAFLHEDSLVYKSIVSDSPDLKVYLEDLSSFQEHGLVLADETYIPADAVVFCTGWKHIQSSLFTTQESLYLGLPTPLSLSPSTHSSHWETLDSLASSEILSKFPLLKDPPPHKSFPATHTQQIQYRGMISPSQIIDNDRSIVFLGNTIVQQTPIHSYIGSLWAIAWLEDLLTSPCPKDTTLLELEREVALQNAFCNRRYIAKGRHQKLVLFEAQGFFDAMIGDMGLRARRHGGWLREWCMPYVARDYRGLVGELVEKKNRMMGKSEVGQDEVSLTEEKDDP